MKMAQRNKIEVEQKSYARFCHVLFGKVTFFWHKFKGAIALLAQTNKAEQHVGVHEVYIIGRLLWCSIGNAMQSD